MAEETTSGSSPHLSSDEPPVLHYEITSKEKRGEVSRDLPMCSGDIPCLACIGPKTITLDPRSGPKSFYFNCGNKLCYISICTDELSDECWKVCYKPVPCEPCQPKGEHEHDYCCTICGAEMPAEQDHKHQHDGQYQYKCKVCNCLPGTGKETSVRQTETKGEEEKYKEICVPEDACCLDANHTYFGRSMIKCCLGDNICELQFWNTKKKPVTITIVYCFEE